MRRTVYDADHEAFRRVIRDFLQAEVVPHHHEWERAGQVPRRLYRRLGELGVFGIRAPVAYGGAGERSYKYNAILIEETTRAGVGLGAAPVHFNLVLPYLMTFADDEQKERWLPPFISGEMMTAIAMTEPGAGSDLAGITTTATLSEDGKHYVLRGSKTFISGGAQADLVLVVARIPGDERRGLSVLCVDAHSPGFTVGRRLEKIGLHAQDTVELFFDEVRVPAANLLGEAGQGFKYLVHNLAEERMAIALGATAQAAAAVRHTVAYVKERKAFGRAVSTFQNTKFVLADCTARVQAMQAMTDRALDLFDAGELSAVDAAACKLFASETAGQVIDQCLQLHGGYGFVTEFPIARLYADTRVTRLYGGTSEIMRGIIADDLLHRPDSV
ncbi:acyl-CoA dehydrogenase family protein [Streptomyces sp. NBC_00847]|uniref:acyl-CoA dehydrogenase family protein n=1 Tax=unclassified Streptomyces TaxID=2593676 RepID=UPI00225C2AF9|nr:acyl-CoA dehydrogenase family protein [Streptomyces sp. NBC_00847]MCX4880414.1 acyl-CoA dehydrogenase family protein [Streptomyces sp. NBC_00847]